MKKFLIFILGFFIGVFLFLPKNELYFLLQKELKRQNIYISAQTNSDITKLTLKNGSIFYESMEVARFKTITAFIYVLYDKIIINDLKLEIGNYKVLKAIIIYSVINPFKAEITAKANFADIKGYIDLKNRNVKLYFSKIKDFSIKRFLKKDKKGYYYYARF